MSLAEAALAYLVDVLVATGGQLAVVLGPLLLAASAMTLVSRGMERAATRLMGLWYLRLFGWLGTAVHEGGHALFCVVFRHEITRMKLFETRPAARHAGTMGYVDHRWNPRSPYQRIGNFFIGVGPLVLGTAVVYGAARLLLGTAVLAPLGDPALEPAALGSWSAFVGAGRELAAGVVGVLGRLLHPDRLTDWRFWGFAYVAFAVGSAVTLSRDDLRGAAAGFGTLCALLALLNLATLHLGDAVTHAAARTGAAAGTLVAAMTVAVALNLAAAAAMLPLAVLTGAVSRRLARRR